MTNKLWTELGLFTTSDGTERWAVYNASVQWRCGSWREHAASGDMALERLAECADEVVLRLLPAGTPCPHRRL
jgi:hypothetical protein